MTTQKKILSSIMSKLGKKGGSVKSSRKAESSRKNGKAYWQGLKLKFW